jgi:hypothetical protein
LRRRTFDAHSPLVSPGSQAIDDCLEFDAGGRNQEAT